MKKRKVLAGAALFSALVLVAAACGGGEETPPNPTATATTTGGGGGAAGCPDTEFGCVTVGAQDPINVGALLTITGATATLGQPTLNGISLGIDYLDGKFDGVVGKLLDHNVKVTVGDETDPTSGQCGKAGGQTAATKLAADPTIVGVIGTNCSSSALGVADTILGDKGIILVSPSNTSTRLTSESEHNPFYFRTAQNDAIQAKVVADFVYKELGITTAATMNDGGPYTSGLTQGFAQFFTGLGGTITADEAFDPTLEDFRPLLTSIAQGKPGLIYFPNFNPPCALISIQAQEIPELSGVKLMGSDGCNDATFIDTAKDAADGVYLSSPVASPGAAAALFDQLDKAYKSQYGVPASAFWPNAFDAFDIIKKSIEQVAIKQSDGSLLIPRAALRDAMYGIKDFEGVTGPLTCISTGDCQSQLAVNIGVYVGPETPYNPATPDAKPVFTEKFTLTEALTG
jgi:branched-chain amino acid transport system substrate-binding protein